MLGLPIGNDFKQYLLNLADVACKKAISIPCTDGVANGKNVSIMCAAFWMKDHYPATYEQVMAEISMNARNCLKNHPNDGMIEVAREFANALDRLFIEQEDFKKTELGSNKS